MVLGIPIAKIITFSVVGLLATVFLKDAFEKGLGNTLGAVGFGGQAIGGALSSTGTGIQGFLTGIGTGVSQLLNPLFTLKELAGPIIGVSSGGTGGSSADVASGSVSFAESGIAETEGGTAPASSGGFFDSLSNTFGFRQLDSAFRTLTFQGPAPVTQTVGGIGGFVQGQPIQQFSFSPVGPTNVQVTTGDGSKIRNVSQLTADSLVSRGFRLV